MDTDLDQFTDGENIQTKLVQTDNDKFPYAIITRDMDVEQLIGRINCPSQEMAEQKFKEMKGKTIMGSNRTASLSPNDKVKFIGDFPSGSIGEQFKDNGAVGVVIGDGHDPDYVDFDGDGPPSDSEGFMNVSVEDFSMGRRQMYEFMVPSKNLEKVAMEKTSALDSNGQELQVGDKAVIKNWRGRGDVEVEITRSSPNQIGLKYTDESGREVKTNEMADGSYQIEKLGSVKKQAYEITDSVGEPVNINDEVIDLETDAKGVIIDISSSSAYVEWDNGRAEWAEGEQLLKSACQKRKADQTDDDLAAYAAHIQSCPQCQQANARMVGRRDPTDETYEVAGFCPEGLLARKKVDAYTSSWDRGASVRQASTSNVEAARSAESELWEEAGEPQSGTFLRQEPWMSKFIEKFKAAGGTPLSDDELKELEEENNHSVIYCLTMSGMVSGTYYTPATYAARRSASMDYGTRVELKDDPGQAYLVTKVNEDGSFNLTGDFAPGGGPRMTLENVVDDDVNALPAVFEGPGNSAYFRGLEEKDNPPS